ncbi:hypothetical protein BKI52_19360 [marine bacterium AO1-C]|nr:hypothetical protein BKI52_19360 [marine bacterium AO1-C]
MFTIKHLAISTIYLIGFIFLASCGKTAPYLPDFHYEDAKEVVIKPVKVNSVRATTRPLFNKQVKIAVLNFKSPNNTNGGVLISDVFASALQKNGYKITERDNIDLILKEQNLISGGSTNLSDLEIAQKLGQLLAADYMIFGAVTLYKSEGQNIHLPIKIKEKDRQEYQKEYEEYRKYFVGGWFPLFQSEKSRLKKMRKEHDVLSLPELDERLKKVSKKEFRTIASVGIAAKIVDVRNAKIVWMGQSETNDFTLVSGGKRIIAKFIESIQRK